MSENDCPHCGQDLRLEPDTWAELLRLKSELALLGRQRDELRICLLLVLDAVDYTANACEVNEMVGAVLPREILTRAKNAVSELGSIQETT